MAPSVRQRDVKAFEPADIVTSIGDGRKAMLFSRLQTILSPEDATDSVFYILEGTVHMTVLSGVSQEVAGVLQRGDFFGESCLAGKRLRIATAIALTGCAVLRIEKKQMLKVLHREPALLEMFVAYLLRTIRFEKELAHQSADGEKRAARVLLLLGYSGRYGVPNGILPEISEAMLTDMVGRVRSRAAFYMSRFRELEFLALENGNEGEVPRSLLHIV